MSDWIILDRDGVINELVPGGVCSLQQWRPVPGSIEAMARLTRAGYRLVVVSNQSGIARGELDGATLAAIEAHMAQKVAEAGGEIMASMHCPHSPEDRCNCRKPRTGLLDQIEERFGVDLTGAAFVGDSLKDIQAAKAKECQAVLVRTGKGTQTETSTLLWPKYGKNTLIYSDLLEFSAAWLERRPS